ncbi:hypothetical protein C0989_009113 [Termitomyces sp. Mn162]|nr:hypothetical protein C0989_009113 [Termitomyces sp. Mn162]
MGEFSGTIIRLFNAKRQVTEQGGLLSGKDPTAINPSDPIRLWIIQLGIIIATASLLSLGLRRIRQPKVIAEVLGGILLGPTAFGVLSISPTTKAATNMSSQAAFLALQSTYFPKILAHT